MNRTKGSFLQHLLRSNGGMAVAEFALLLPMLMTLFYGCIETTRYILVTQKAEKLAHTVANVTAGSTTVTLTSLSQLMQATNDIMSPFDFADTGAVIITSLYRAAGANGPTVNWQYTGGGNLIASSSFGAVGASPILPTNFTFDERENVIAAEVFYQYSPLISSQFFGTTTIYRRAYYKPRFGLLTTAPS